ncbi:hypothetical protein [Hymenobacter cellulosivorans]|uniref:Uncharacterized protein n=1 Tax=Hymenobacter cellulosivorans TaxID=2932249 RepID=A0ABY4F2T5_9BACT|nr:hypothetical protein [Hymenobacter cellulosivorans]UOQ50980.1 hypothetical protein MUN80_14565 [Hymenobacter cellulosivorans]
MIFAGRLVRVIHPADQPATTVYQFVVTRTWRGARPDTITLLTDPGNCGLGMSVGLEPGKSYLLFTDPKQGLSSCHRMSSTNLPTKTQKLDKLFRRRRFQQLQT